MFVAAYVLYKRNQEEVDNTVAIGKGEAIRAITSAGATIRTRSTQVIDHALRCYPSEERVGDSDIFDEDDENDSNSIIASMVTSSDALPDIFADDIRQEWIDATFGKDFYASEDYTPPRQGVGDAGIPSYVTFEAIIPSNSSDFAEKVGVTLSKIAIGLYVRKIEPGSEAQCAGIREGSILVDINGLGMLGEPSRQALERLWQYEGFLGDDYPSVSDDSTHRGPLAMRFYKSGMIYTAIMFLKGPYGISWAPCGNFALVQKTYSFAEKAGARRGCLVAAVNMRSMRDMDHEVAAAEIRDLFVGGKQISLTLCYTPAASRSGFFERATNGNADVPNKIQSPKAKRTIASADGVEVRIHPLEYGLFWKRKPNLEPTNKFAGGTSELAARVVAGEVEAPTGFKHLKLSLTEKPVMGVPKVNRFSKCPPLPKEQLLAKWDSLDALGYCLRVHQASYDEDRLFAMIGASNDGSVLQMLQLMMQTEDAWKAADAFLLQWVSLLCISTDEENSFCADANAHDWSEYIRELSLMLLELSRCDNNFCQRLHFILRSYTATLEGHRRKDDSSRNVLNLLQALERLRAAQKELAAQLINTSSRVRVSSIDHVETENIVKTESQDFLQIAASASGAYSEGRATSHKKPKSMFKIFRKKHRNSGEAFHSTSGSLRSRHSTPDLLSIRPEPTQVPASMKKRTASLSSLASQLEFFSVPSLLENMNRFLAELDGICDTIEGSLLKSISQKIADWALQPWSDSKESELAKVTDGMRQGLRSIMASGNPLTPLVNPIEAGEVLASVDADECYILPSAHFPLLLTFNVRSKQNEQSAKLVNSNHFVRQEHLYRTKVEIVAIRGSASPMKPSKNGSSDGKNRNARAYVVQAAVAGTIMESGRSVPLDDKSKVHSWLKDGILTFETRSCWGPPQTLSLSVSTVSIGSDGHEQVVHSDDKGKLHYASEIGHCWVDMKPLWDRIDGGGHESSPSTVSCHAQVWSLQSSEPFDQHGELRNGMAPVPERLELELRVSNERLNFGESEGGYQSRKRMLLYKHDDDLRQEMFAIQFINVCGSLLKASGLDLKLLTFRCIPVGSNRGFIEWIPGSVPLSDVCQPLPGGAFARSSSDESENRKRGSLNGRDDPLSEVAKAGLFKYESLPRSPTKQAASVPGQERENSLINNSIQEFLRSTAYDPHAPYFIQREVMDNFVKSCAGYCVLTYLLGVGDRHLDNLLLHQSGHFFHCDYSFILGNDPKKYLPMRITEHMIHGMGGRDSDNYARFLSLAGATFIALRRHENVRVILSMVHLMIPSALPDVSVNQSPGQALEGVVERLRLDLSDENAITYMEQLIEDSVCSKLWLALDAMHSIGKRF